MVVLRPDNEGRFGRGGVLTAVRMKYKLLAVLTTEIVPKQQSLWGFLLLVFFLLLCWLVV